MSDSQPCDRKPWIRSWPLRVGLMLLGIAVFVAMGIVIENEIGLSFWTTYRVACAGICLFLILKLRFDYPGERWPLISFWIALFVNGALFFTPLVNRPASRGELMLFLFPDLIIVLVARILTYRVTSVEQRASRQMMVLGLIGAVIFCAVLFYFGLREAQAVG